MQQADMSFLGYIKIWDMIIRYRTSEMTVTMYRTQFQDLQPVRLDKYVASILDGISREQIKDLIHHRYVLLNGRVVLKPSTYLAKGDVIEIDMAQWKHDTFLKHQPTIDQDLANQVQVVFEHSDFIIVNKPAGLLVHRTNAPHSFSLVEVLKEIYPEIEGIQEEIQQRSDGNVQDRSGIVLRIDRDTSGLLIVARNFEAFYWFKHAFAQRQIVKRYKCLVMGKLTESMGEITFPITRSRLDHSKRVAIMNASDSAFYDTKKSALTEYTVHTRYEKTTLLEVYLHTGRTHQIRVHMKAIGHPIIGDPYYGVLGKDIEPRLERQFLHADLLRFDYHGLPVQVSSELPNDLMQYLMSQQKLVL
jgi:23S rRNA pseudouridine1911/1915/1917 synthase